MTLNHKGYTITVNITPKPDSCYKCPFFEYSYSEGEPFGSHDCKFGAEDHWGVADVRAKDCPLDNPNA